MEMEMEIELTTSLIVCPECHSVFQYYDFLSHSYDSNCSINIRNTENTGDADNTEDTDDTEDTDNTEDTDDTEMDSNLDTNVTMPIHMTTYNGLNDYGNYGNYGNSSHLYNPMINRGFQDSDDAIYTLHNYLLSLNINSNTIPIHSGLNKKELEKNSNIIECNDSTDCSICLCNFPKHTHFYLMKCTHSFCINCCETWFSKNSLCPLCRTNYKL